MLYYRTTCYTIGLHAPLSVVPALLIRVHNRSTMSLVSVFSLAVFVWTPRSEFVNIGFISDSGFSTRGLSNCVMSCSELRLSLVLSVTWTHFPLQWMRLKVKQRPGSCVLWIYLFIHLFCLSMLKCFKYESIEHLLFSLYMYVFLFYCDQVLSLMI